jgi:hypothetical protein
VNNLAKLRAEWKDVDILFLDEASLLSAQLLCEIDYTLRYVKENFDECFGGLSIIFAGDFYQYPPVMSTALWAPIPAHSQSTASEVQQHLGRITWKRLETVVTLDEQKRMAGDPVYTESRLRLRTCTCTLSDVALFNSRVIKSLDDPDGINMSNGAYPTAAAIVNTNHVQEELNVQKAQANAALLGLPLTVCAAKDIDHDTKVLVRPSLRTQLLKMDTSRLTSSGALPGLLPMYTRMPVILRMHNISTDLRITNGAQGILKKVVTEKLADDTEVPKITIVHFPASKVKLRDLPARCFPIEPISWSFTAVLLCNTSKGQETIRIRRYQLPIQPAFAVTGQSTQGKTLPVVLAALHEGGFGAYIAASRAKSREGLCIVRQVSLADLNKPLPHDLLAEMKRLLALEHNTSVRLGFSTEAPQPVPDPELEAPGICMLPNILIHHSDAGDSTDNRLVATKIKEAPSKIP